MKIDNIIDIEKILYNGKKEEIRKLIKEYQITYSYDKNNKSTECSPPLWKAGTKILYYFIWYFYFVTKECKKMSDGLV